jgi:ClpP class serine protease
MLHRILQKFYGEPWAIDPAIHKQMGLALQAHMQGAPAPAAAVSVRGRKDFGEAMLSKLDDGIGVIALDGIIGKHLSMMELECADGYCLTLFNSALDAAAASGIDTLVLDINSPGGTVTGLPEAAARLQEITDSGIHTIAYTESLCCSAAYWLACACDEIHAAPTARIGSIGCYCAAIDDTRFWEIQGIKVEYFIGNDAPHKAEGAPGRPITDDQRTELKEIVDEWATAFAEHVAARRADIEDIGPVTTGRAWFAGHAPAGVVDSTAFHRIEDLLGFIKATAAA